MKKITLIIFIFNLYTNAFSQRHASDSIKESIIKKKYLMTSAKKDSSSIGRKKPIIFDKQELKILLNEQFSEIITGNSFSNYGKYISINTEDETLKLAGVAVDSLVVWSYSLSASDNNGVLSIFSGQKLNSNFSGKIVYNKIVNIFKKRRKGIKGRSTTNEIGWHFDDEKFNKEKLKIENKFKSDSIDIIFLKDSLNYIFKIKSIDEKLKRLALLNSKCEKLEIKCDDLKKDSITYQRERLKFDKKSLNDEVKKFSKKKFLSERKEQKKENLNKIRKERIEGITIEELDLTWFSLGYNLKKKSFDLFDSNKELSEQIIDSSSVSHGLSIALSRYKNLSNNKANFYWTAGLNFKVTDNLNQLDTYEVEDIKEITNGRKLKKKTLTHLFNEYKNNLIEYNIFFDYYRSLFHKNLIAIHINPNLTFTSNNKRITSTTLGLLIPIRKDEESSFVNIELFYDMNDIFNDLKKKESSFFKRNSFGIRTTFPLKIKTNSKK